MQNLLCLCLLVSLPNLTHWFGSLKNLEFIPLNSVISLYANFTIGIQIVLLFLTFRGVFGKCLWRLKVPGKIKHFLWKACTNSLPSKVNLRKRKILEEAVCPRCSGGLETVEHALWSCECVKVVWDSEFGWVDRSAVTFESFSDVLDFICAKPAALALFAVTAWAIWTQRNKVRLHDNPLPLCNVVGFAKTYLKEFKDMHSPPILKNRVIPRRWTPLAAGTVKINYDEAMFGESDRAGLGVVIRSCEGQVVAALSEQITKPPTVEILELLAARRAISFSAELEHLHCVCKGDSLSVVNALKGSGLVLSSGGHLLADISSLSNSFQSISFAHVGRQGNAVAHALAQRARSSLSTHIWLECVSTDIMSFVLDDFPIS